MAAIRAWSLITVGEDRQYAGNRGYDDDPRRLYRYDSQVANHRNVYAGHIALIRNRDHLLGVARIERISVTPGAKTMRRCPDCHTANIRAREQKHPRYRCVKGHTFDEPVAESVAVSLFEAHYESSFAEVPDEVPIELIKAAASRPSDQLSIEEIDLASLERSLSGDYRRTRAILASFFHADPVDPDDAAEDAPISDGTEESQIQQPYAKSSADTRESVLRSIRQRRGQRKFRDALMKRYASRCVVTDCALADVLEAAHIWPYRGEGDNHPENGLLLRADVHTLFDLDLLAINPETLVIELAPVLMQTDAYAALQGRALNVSAGTRPAPEPLVNRWTVFRRLHFSA